MTTNPPVQCIYVYLLNEGTDVWRPVSAIPNPDGTYTILENDYHGPETEDWEFLPGTRVICKYREFPKARVLVAIQVAP